MDLRYSRWVLLKPTESQPTEAETKKRCLRELRAAGDLVCSEDDLTALFSPPAEERLWAVLHQLCQREAAADLYWANSEGGTGSLHLNTLLWIHHCPFTEAVDLWLPCVFLNDPILLRKSTSRRASSGLPLITSTTRLCATSLKINWWAVGCFVTKTTANVRHTNIFKDWREGKFHLHNLKGDDIDS